MTGIQLFPDVACNVDGEYDATPLISKLGSERNILIFNYPMSNQTMICL